MDYRKEDRIVPRAEMQQGIDLCKTNVIDFLKDAKLIIAENRLNHAYVSIQFAIEELGKLLFLKDALQRDTNDPVVLEKEIFTGGQAHAKKEERAWKFLDPKYKIIFDEGWAVKGLFEKGLAQEDTMAETETRLDCSFADFYTQQWHLGRDIKPELLLALINHIESRISGVS